MNRLPNFLVVGTAKAGTTSLFRYLSQHPQVFIPSKKECMFFSEVGGKFPNQKYNWVNDKATRSLEDYCSLFSDATEEIALGDISHDYLYYYETSICNIRKYLDDPKIIILLRDPIKRAISHYYHHVSGGIALDISFRKAISQEKFRLDYFPWIWHYTRVGKYYEGVSAYKRSFRNVKIVLFDDLIEDPNNVMKDIFRFLDVDDQVVVDTSGHYNKGRYPILIGLQLFLINWRITTSNKYIKLILNLLIKWNSKRKPTVPSDIKTKLINEFKDEIDKLEKLIERDLSNWLK